MSAKPSRNFTGAAVEIYHKWLHYYYYLKPFMSLIQPPRCQHAAFKKSVNLGFSWSTFWICVGVITTDALPRRQPSWSKMEQNPQKKKAVWKSCSHLTSILLNLWYFQSLVQQMDAVLVFMPFWYSHSRPFLLSWRVLRAPHSRSLFVPSKSACLPLKPPLLLRLWCKSGRRQWVLTCQLSWLPEGWLWARVC